MTVGELIEHLQQFPKDMLVVKHVPHQHVPKWDTMDGHWWRTVEVVRHQWLGEVYYREKSRGGDDPVIEALEL